MKHEQITIRLPQELYDKLKQQADNKGYPMKDYVVFALQRFVSGSEY